MLKITVSVPEDRSEAGLAVLMDGATRLLEEVAVASADVRNAKRQGNAGCDPMRPGGHPPVGRYELAARGDTPPGAQGEYGNVLLLFEPKSGPALEAEARGRLGLLVYSGARGRDLYPRRTQGGVRLTQTLISALLARLNDETEVELHIVTVAKRPWWAFWRKPLACTPFSKDGLLIEKPPLDEASLAAALAGHARPRGRTTPVRDDDERERTRRDDNDSSSSSSSEREFRGGGGTGGGGGASGGWTDAPGRAPGVDAAGRVIAAAGIAAVAASAAAHVADRPSETTTTYGETPEDTSAGTSSSDTTSSVDTTTHTAY